MRCESSSLRSNSGFWCAEKRIHLSLLANPSHLEAVDPIVLGKVRICALFQMPCIGYTYTTQLCRARCASVPRFSCFLLVSSRLQVVAPESCAPGAAVAEVTWEEP